MIFHFIYLVPDRKYAKLHKTAIAEKDPYPLNVFLEHEITQEDVALLAKEKPQGRLEDDHICEESQENYLFVRKSSLLRMFFEDIEYLDSPEDYQDVECVADLEGRIDIDEIYAQGLEIYKSSCSLANWAQGKKGLITHYINIISDEDADYIFGKME